MVVARDIDARALHRGRAGRVVGYGVRIAEAGGIEMEAASVDAGAAGRLVERHDVAGEVVGPAHEARAAAVNVLPGVALVADDRVAAHGARIAVDPAAVDVGAAGGDLVIPHRVVGEGGAGGVDPAAGGVARAAAGRGALNRVAADHVVAQAAPPVHPAAVRVRIVRPVRGGHTVAGDRVSLQDAGVADSPPISDNTLVAPTGVVPGGVAGNRVVQQAAAPIRAAAIGLRPAIGVGRGGVAADRVVLQRPAAGIDPAAVHPPSAIVSRRRHHPGRVAGDRVLLDQGYASGVQPAPAHVVVMVVPCPLGRVAADGVGDHLAAGGIHPAAVQVAARVGGIGRVARDRVVVDGGVDGPDARAAARSAIRADGDRVALHGIALDRARALGVDAAPIVQSGCGAVVTDRVADDARAGAGDVEAAAGVVADGGVEDVGRGGL